MAISDADAKFQSTPPRREVTRDTMDAATTVVISIHTSPKGGDEFHANNGRSYDISIHTSPKGGDIRRI